MFTRMQGEAALLSFAVACEFMLGFFDDNRSNIKKECVENSIQQNKNCFYFTIFLLALSCVDLTAHSSYIYLSENKVTFCLL